MYNETIVKDRIWGLACMLPESPDEGYRMWFDGEEILCETEQMAEHLADFFDMIYRGQTVTTGYYDPEEDKHNGEVNNHTGWYYVTIG